MPQDHNGRLIPGSAYQLWITRGEGRVHITEVEPGLWREYVYTEGFAAIGNWYQRHSLDCEPRPCAAHDVPPRLREAARFALTW